MARVPYTSAIRRVVPPWLQRLVGARVLESLAAQADAAVEQLVDGVLLRFPGVTTPIDPGALALIGSERRIRRGPSEDAATYARRLRGWWDAHRTRGGPYALLGQLRAFFFDWLPVRMDVVYYSGTRRWMDEDGVITRDAIEWTASGKEEGEAFGFAANVETGADSIYLGGYEDAFPARGPYVVRVWDGADSTGELATVLQQTPDGYLLLESPIAGGPYSAGSGRVARENVRWAHVWLFLYCPDEITGLPLALVTDDGDAIVTDDGEGILAETTIALADGLTSLEEAVFTAIPREWSAAHIPYITVVLLFGARRLWDYPVPVPTYDEWEADGALWGESPIMLIAE